jgi:hypothetical protein
MADKWIIKPIGTKKLDVTVPDSFTLEAEVASVPPEVLLRALAEWLELQEAGGKVGDAKFCIIQKNQ